MVLSSVTFTFPRTRFKYNLQKVNTKQNKQQFRAAAETLKQHRRNIVHHTEDLIMSV